MREMMISCARRVMEVGEVQEVRAEVEGTTNEEAFLLLLFGV